MRALIVIGLLLPAVTAADVPLVVSYQGRLLKADGTPVTGVSDVTFSLYGAETGGSALWTETQSLGLTNGFYATHLGKVAALPAAQLDGRDLYLEVSVGGSALAPRQRVGSVPYAIQATSANNATNATNATNAANATNATNAYNVTGGTVNASSAAISGDESVTGNVSAASVSTSGGVVVGTNLSANGTIAAPTLSATQSLSVGSGGQKPLYVNGGALFSLPGATLPAGFAGGQMYLGWNASGGMGETDFFDHGAGGWAGGFDFYSIRDGDPTVRLQARIRGDNGTVYSRGGFATLSDGREKGEIRPIIDGLDRIMKLRGVSFVWKDDREHRKNLGLVAQEILPVVPELVTTSAMGDRYAVSYDGLIPLLIESIKQQQRTIERLSARIEDLEKRTPGAGAR